MLVMMSIVAGGGAASPVETDWESAYRQARDKLSELTLEEKIHFIRGYSEFYFYGIPEKGIPFLYHSDATGGVNIRRNLPDTALVKPLDRSTAMPCPQMLASTFNADLAYRYASAVGEECRAGGIEILLGPGVNIARNSQCGRNFEYFGEDPYLSGVMCAQYVKGLQSTGTAACVKHFICNETEFYRRRSNSVVSDRALHEIYLPPFKAGIDAGAAFVMTSYNQLNGEWTGQNRGLIHDILRKELGFKGCVVSDWSSVYDSYKVVTGGVNTEMPGRKEAIPEVRVLLKEGKITEYDIDRMIEPVLAAGYALGLYNRPKYRPEMLDSYPLHARTAYEVAAEGTVLLKNSGILPLDREAEILVAGRFQDEVPRTGDNPAASAAVKGYDNITLREALTERFGDRVRFEEHPSEEDFKNARHVLVSAGTIDMESFERPFSLPRDQERLILSAVENNPNTIVLVNSGSGVRMTGWADKAAAILYGWYPGQNGMSAIADIIVGKTNPSGKLPITIEREFSDSPARNTMPEGAEFYHTAYRAYNERLIGIYDVDYAEDVFVGYRWYDSRGIAPLFPFGHGLSYSRWELGKPSVAVRDGRVKVTVTLSNTGPMAGAQVVQVYVSESAPAVPRPVKELKAFSKVNLAPGSSRKVCLEIDRDALGFYDEKEKRWMVNPGEYILHIGFSSDDLPVKIPFKINFN